MILSYFDNHPNSTTSDNRQHLLYIYTVTVKRERETDPRARLSPSSIPIPTASRASTDRPIALTPPHPSGKDKDRNGTVVRRPEIGPPGREEKRSVRGGKSATQGLNDTGRRDLVFISTPLPPSITRRRTR